MRITEQLLVTILELLAALVALTYVINALAFKGGTESVLLCGMWFVISQLAGISRKLSKD